MDSKRGRAPVINENGADAGTAENCDIGLGLKLLMKLRDTLHIIQSLRDLEKERNNIVDDIPERPRPTYGLWEGDIDTEDGNLFDIHNFVKRNIDKANNSVHLAKQMYQDIKKTSHIKVIEAAVPEGILSPDYSAHLSDVRIAGHGPDESVYRKNKWIREHVTRGLTFMEISGKKKFFDFAIYANKKFTGGVGDEDEHQPENNDVWREFCLQSPESATEVICMTKLNGEAAHFTVREIGGEFYIIAGSKNVHMLFKNYEDIDKYKDSRYLVARTVAKAILDTFNSMEETKLCLLKHFLNVTKITVVCEILQPNYQHIVNLSYLKDASIIMLMFASVASDEENSFTALPPDVALTLGKAFGLPTAEYIRVTVDNVREHIKNMRAMKNSEGYVFYYLNGSHTIGLAKVKTAWYVMLRALREKADNTFNGKCKKDSTLPCRIKATKQRFGQIQKWIGFCDAYRISWEDLGEAFILWLDVEIKKGNVNSKEIRPRFPIVWEQFLKATKNTDEFELGLT